MSFIYEKMIISLLFFGRNIDYYCQVAWAVLTMATAGARHPQDIMAIRFFQAIFESSTFVGTHYST
jgi:hypothetical protein